MSLLLNLSKSINSYSTTIENTLWPTRGLRPNRRDARAITATIILSIYLFCIKDFCMLLNNYLEKPSHSFFQLQPTLIDDLKQTSVKFSNIAQRCSVVTTTLFKVSCGLVVLYTLALGMSSGAKRLSAWYIKNHAEQK